jgi:hypothetical protein
MALHAAQEEGHQTLEVFRAQICEKGDAVQGIETTQFYLGLTGRRSGNDTGVGVIIDLVLYSSHGSLLWPSAAVHGPQRTERDWHSL